MLGVCVKTRLTWRVEDEDGGKEGMGQEGGKGGERREEAGVKEHQELGWTLERLHSGPVQTNAWK